MHVAVNQPQYVDVVTHGDLPGQQVLHVLDNDVHAEDVINVCRGATVDVVDVRPRCRSG